MIFGWGLPLCWEPQHPQAPVMFNGASSEFFGDFDCLHLDDQVVVVRVMVVVIVLVVVIVMDVMVVAVAVCSGCIQPYE